MAHRFKVVARPHTNKDGSASKTKKDYFVIHTGRGGRRVLPARSRTEAEFLIDEERQALIDLHLMRHPNDVNFRRKHGIPS